MISRRARNWVAMGLSMAVVAAAPSAAMAEVCHGVPGGVRLLLRVLGVRSDKGQLAVTVYGDNKKTFLKEQGEVETIYDPAKTGVATICLTLPHAGHYAFVVYHDVNANKDLDTGVLGIPKEGYAFSNNVRPVLSAPSYDSAKIDVAASGDTTAEVRLRYP